MYIVRTLIMFGFFSLQLQAFNVIRSKCGNPVKLEQTELSFINAPLPSVPQLTSNPKVKLSYIPLLHCHRKTGQFFDTHYKTEWFFILSKFPFLQIFHLIFT